MLIPVAAVGRTADAFGGIADCGMVVRMTRGRAWIVVLGVLLGGIVALNVWGLGMSASSSATAAKIDALQRQNSVLGGRIANRTSNGTIEQAAAKLGLAVSPADGVQYLDAAASDAERAAERLANGRISLSPAPAPTVVEPLDATVVATDPAAVPTGPAAVPTEPATVDPATTGTVPVEATAVEAPPVAPASDPATATPVDPVSGALAP
ncbi:MAG: hypothetical protein M3Q53_07040 [Actinomycetota bacterium]|nr:hypothetical protein [Actinomycetota bacterium]